MFILSLPDVFIPENLEDMRSMFGPYENNSNIEERTSTGELVGEILQEGGDFKVLQDKRSRSTQEKWNHSRPSDLGELHEV